PAYVYLPNYLGWGQAIRRPGPYAGFLGKRFDPLFTECSPYVENPPKTPHIWDTYPIRGEPRLPESQLREGISIDRLNVRRTLLQQMDRQLRRLESNSGFASHDRMQQQAFSILTSPQVKAAFDLSNEDPRLRDRYGRTLFGASTLVARKLVVAGGRFVNVAWDL